jgi:putative heme-binding domain-containing protein
MIFSRVPRPLLNIALGLVAVSAWRPAFCQAPQGNGPALNPFDTPEGRAQGSALFQMNCAYCHGAHGEGGRGADLTTGTYKHGGSDRDLFSNIRNGISGTDMPAVRMTDEEAWKLAAWVKSLGSSGNAEQAPGDAANGKAIYAGKGRCAACHSIGGEGGSVGPDLAGVGSRRGLTYLMESLVSPEADVAPAYRAVLVVTKSGQSVGGIRLNEDDVSIQLRDSDGNLRSFFKDDLNEIRRDKPSLMPGYGSVLNRKELEDVVAYLSSLRSSM